MPLSYIDQEIHSARLRLYGRIVLLCLRMAPHAGGAMTFDIRRRDFIAALGGAAGWPLTARAQQPELPVIGLINGGSADSSAVFAASFRKGLDQTGYAEGRNVTV